MHLLTLHYRKERGESPMTLLDYEIPDHYNVAAAALIKKHFEPKFHDVSIQYRFTADDRIQEILVKGYAHDEFVPAFVKIRPEPGDYDVRAVVQDVATHLESLLQDRDPNDYQ